MSAKLDRLLPTLNTSGIQIQNPPLYQVIKDLIEEARKLEKALAAASGGGSTNITNIEQIYQILNGDSGGDGDSIIVPGPAGARGADGATGAVGPPFPAFIVLDPEQSEDILPIPGPQGIQGPTGATGATGPPYPAFITPNDADSENNNLLGIPSEVAKRNEPNAFSGQQKISGLYFSPLVDNGTSGAAKTIDWASGNDQYLELSNNCTLTFSNPQDGSRHVLLVKGGFTITWPASVVWPGGTAPTISATYDLFTFMYKSSLGKYVGAYSLNYAL